MIGQYDSSVQGLGRGNTFKFFYKTVQKKKALKNILDNVLPTLTSIDQVDCLNVPKWSKKFFRYEYATKIEGKPTIEQIFASMENEIKDSEVVVYRYYGPECTIGINPLELNNGDYVSIIGVKLVNVNHHPITVSEDDIYFITSMDYIGTMTNSERINKISEYLSTKYI